MKTLRLLITGIILASLAISAVGQNNISVASLDTIVSETSGLLFLKQRLITHNDSGGEPALYEIDTVSGDVVRTVIIRNAVNHDWEDICCDDKYIYVGDFGNNFGTRKNLGIYKVLISDYLDTQNDSVDAQLISFSYADQTDFSPNPQFTNFDAEAMISYNDSLYIFTKNWGNGLSDIYACPKTPGSYKLRWVDFINAKGLVTGAIYNSESNSILFCGYAFVFPFIMELSNFSSTNFSEGIIKRYFLKLDGNTQIEGIAQINHQSFFSSEAKINGEPALYSFNEGELAKMKQRKRQPGRSFLIQLMKMVKNSVFFKIVLWGFPIA